MMLLTITPARPAGLSWFVGWYNCGMADVVAAYAALTIAGCVFLIYCATVYTLSRHRRAGIVAILFLSVWAVAHAVLLADAARVIIETEGRQATP
jgi:chromate transport protein ChrA